MGLKTGAASNSGSGPKVIAGTGKGTVKTTTNTSAVLRKG